MKVKVSNIKNIIISIFLLFSIFSCNNVVDKSKKISKYGFVFSRGYLSNVKVCLDKNLNYLCDKDEPYSVTYSGGKFLLSDLSNNSDDFNIFPLVAELSKDSYDNNNDVYNPLANTFVSIIGSPYFISPYTTIMHLKNEKDGEKLDQINEFLKSEFNLKFKNNLEQDYIKKENKRVNILAEYLNSIGSLKLSKAKKNHKDYQEVLYNIYEELLNSSEKINKYLESQDDKASESVRSFKSIKPKVISSRFNLFPSKVTPFAFKDNFSDPINFTQGMNYGSGFDVMQSKVIGTAGKRCLKITETASSDFTVKQLYRTIKVLKNKDDLDKTLGISASVTMSFGTLGATIEGRVYDQTVRSSSSVYAVIKLKYIYNNYSIRNLEFTDDPKVRNLYETNYEGFRLVCGDKYLDKISRGSTYYALLKIETKNKVDHREIGARLEGRYLIFTASGEVDLVFKDIVKTHKVEAYIFTRGRKVYKDGGTVINIENFNDFIKDYHKFKEHLNNIIKVADSGDESVMVPISAQFEDYTTLPNVPIGTDSSLEDKNTIQEYNYYINEYDKVYKAIDRIIKQPYFFKGATAKMSILIKNKNKTRQYKERIKRMAKKCSKPLNRVCTSLESEFIKDAMKRPEDIKAELPREIPFYPSSCREYLAYTSDRSSGIKNLYLGGEFAKRLPVFCDNMESGAPQEFLPLYSTSSASSDPRNNFSQYVGLKTQGGNRVSLTDTQTLTTVFSKLKVRLNKDHVLVDPGQKKYLKTHGGPVFSNDSKSNLEITRGVFGTSKVCGKSSKRWISANINLTGTPLKVDPNQEFTSNEFEYDVVKNPKNWFSAQKDARSKGGYLLTVADDKDTQKFKTIINLYDKNSDMESIWIGLIRDPEELRHYMWESQYPYESYQNWAYDNLLYNEFDKLYCGVMNKDSGKWEEHLCLRTYPYIIEYKKMRKEIKVTDNGQVVDLKVWSELDSECSTLEPKNNLKLVHK